MRFPLAQAAEAHKVSQARHFRGKLVLDGAVAGGKARSTAGGRYMEQARESYSRRALLGSALALAAAGLTAPYCGPVAASARLPKSPFTLGVASGDPTPDGIVLWTRLALDLEDGARWGLSEEAYRLGWEVRDLEASGTPVVRSGTAIAARRNAYAVHVEVTGLRPGRAYGYRFTLDDHGEDGLTRTAPAPGDMPESLRFAFCSCAEYENAFHYAYRFMANAKPQFILHLGDYIYEQTYDEYYVRDGGRGAKPKPQGPAVAQREECIEGPSPDRKRKLKYDRVGKLRALAQYRRRYGEYKLDEDLKFAHKQCPFIVTWDDHEVDNDYAGTHSAVLDEENFTQRRMHAYRAYFENLPIRLSALPQTRQRPAPLPPLRLRRADAPLHAGRAPVPLGPGLPEEQDGGQGAGGAARGRLPQRDRRRRRCARTPARDAGRRAGGVAGGAARKLQRTMERVGPGRDDGATSMCAPTASSIRSGPNRWCGPTAGRATSRHASASSTSWIATRRRTRSCSAATSTATSPTGS